MDKVHFQTQTQKNHSLLRQKRKAKFIPVSQVGTYRNTERTDAEKNTDYLAHYIRHRVSHFFSFAFALVCKPLLTNR